MGGEDGGPHEIARLRGAGLEGQAEEVGERQEGEVAEATRARIRASKVAKAGGVRRSGRKPRSALVLDLMGLQVQVGTV